MTPTTAKQARNLRNYVNSIVARLAVTDQLSDEQVQALATVTSQWWSVVAEVYDLCRTCGYARDEDGGWACSDSFHLHNPHSMEPVQINETTTRVPLREEWSECPMCGSDDPGLKLGRERVWNTNPPVYRRNMHYHCKHRFHDSAPKLHSVRCRCDGRSIVPGPDGHAVPCPETEPT